MLIKKYKNNFLHYNSLETYCRSSRNPYNFICIIKINISYTTVDDLVVKLLTTLTTKLYSIHSI